MLPATNDTSMTGRPIKPAGQQSMGWFDGLAEDVEVPRLGADRTGRAAVHSATDRGAGSGTGSQVQRASRHFLIARIAACPRMRVTLRPSLAGVVGPAQTIRGSGC